MQVLSNRRDPRGAVPPAPRVSILEAQRRTDPTIAGLQECSTFASSRFPVSQASTFSVLRSVLGRLLAKLLRRRSNVPPTFRAEVNHVGGTGPFCEFPISPAESTWRNSHFPSQKRIVLYEFLESCVNLCTPMFRSIATFREICQLLWR